MHTLLELLLISAKRRKRFHPVRPFRTSAEKPEAFCRSGPLTHQEDDGTNQLLGRTGRNCATSFTAVVSMLQTVCGCCCKTWNRGASYDVLVLALLTSSRIMRLLSGQERFQITSLPDYLSMKATAGGGICYSGDGGRIADSEPRRAPRRRESRLGRLFLRV